MIANPGIKDKSGRGEMEATSNLDRYVMANNYCDAGIKSYQAGCREEAVRLWHKAIEVKPDFAAAIMNLGAAQKDQGNLPGAVDYFQKALEIQPDSLEAHFNLAVSFHLLGNLGAALPHYLQAIQINPGYADAHTNLDVLLYEHIKDPNLAMACYQSIYERNPRIDAVGPRRIRIETASVCNLRCQHCPTGTNYSGTTRNILDLDMFEVILSQIKTLPIIRDVIFYLGGEPLLNKNLALMCRRVKEETTVALTQFNTNGMLITEEICGQLAEAKLDKICVSIDGSSPEENDEIRRGARYETIAANVRLLAHYLPHTQIGIANTILKRPGDPEEPVTPAFLSQDFPGLPIWTTYAMKWPSLDTHKSSVAQLGSGAKSQPDNFCKMPLTEMAIRPNGDVVMCCYDIAGEMVMGNIQGEALLNIWQSPTYREVRRNILSGKVASLPDVCKRCQQYCGAIPLLRKAEHGSVS